MRDARTRVRLGSNEQLPTAIRTDSTPDTSSTRWPHFKSPEPNRPTCECGEALTTCQGCRELRCLWCDPVTSDDCRWTI